ncbi:DUF6179 domain-containing protein [Intestinibacter sp.]
MKLLGSITKDYTKNVLKWGYLNQEFSETFILGVQHDVGNILKDKIQKYCGNASTSVTVEIGEQLLESIYYTMDLNFRDDFNMHKSIELLKRNSIEDIFKKGEEKLKNLFEETEKLYNKVCKNKYNTELIAYNDTLIKEFGNFFEIYDMKFNTQDIQVSVDYPLIFGDYNLTGIYYIKNYLENIELENKFCNYFAGDEIENLLNINADRYKLNYRDLLTNIFEIVINNTILSIIIDGKFEDFYIFKEGIDYLKSNLNLDNIEAKVSDAVLKMIKQLNIDDEEEIQYINSYKNRFIKELRSSIIQDCIENLIVICDDYLEPSINQNKLVVQENRLNDEDFRNILKEIEDESDIDRKIDIIKQNVNSFDDFCDILKADCFYGEEYTRLFDSLDEIELALLGKSVFYEDIEMGKFNMLYKIFKDNRYDYSWQEEYVEYMKNQMTNKINEVQKNIMKL